MKSFICYFFSTFILLIAINHHVSAAPTGSTSVLLVTNPTAKVQTITLGSPVTNSYTNPSNSQGVAAKCGNGQVIVGYGTLYGTFNNFQFTNGVDFNLSHSRWNNFSQQLMTTGGTRTFTCQAVQLGYH